MSGTTNPFGEDFKKEFKRLTGHDTFATPLPQSELKPEDRFGASLNKGAARLCLEYHPEIRPVTPPEGRVEAGDRSRMSRLLKKAALLYGAEIVRIAKVDQRWLYKNIELPHK